MLHKYTNDANPMPFHHHYALLRFSLLYPFCDLLPHHLHPQYGLVHISVGDLLRDEVSRGSPIGKKAKDFMDRGVLVPDEVVVEMVKERLAEPDVGKKGWLLDGYPRSAVQAEAIEKEKIRPDLFLLINVRGPWVLIYSLCEKGHAGLQGMQYSMWVMQILLVAWGAKRHIGLALA